MGVLVTLGVFGLVVFILLRPAHHATCTNGTHRLAEGRPSPIAVHVGPRGALTLGLNQRGYAAPTLSPVPTSTTAAGVVVRHGDSVTLTLPGQAPQALLVLGCA